MSWSLVQRRNVAGNGVLNTLAFLSPVASGNLIIAGQTGYGSDPPVAQWGDSQGNTYIRDVNLSVSTAQWAAIGHTIAKSGAALTFINAANGSDISIELEEWSFAGPLTIGNTASANALSTGNVTTSGNSLIVAILADLSASIPSGTTGTLGIQVGTVGGQHIATAFQYNANVQTTINPTWSLSGSSGPASVGVAFNEPTVTYALTGPSTGVAGVASTNFTLTPGGVIGGDTVTIGLSGTPNGTTTPTSLTFTGVSTPLTFTYTPTSSGVETIALTSSGGYTITGSPFTYTVTPAPPTTHIYTITLEVNDYREYLSGSFRININNVSHN